MDLSIVVVEYVELWKHCGMLVSAMVSKLPLMKVTRMPTFYMLEPTS